MEREIKGNKIKGNIAGIRTVVLRELEALFFADMEPLRHAFISPEMLQALCFLTTRSNREVMVYIARDGQVLEVIVGQHDKVDLPRVQVRRGKHRLTGVRCIHTHPGGISYLSDADIKALKRMRFDAMAAIGVDDAGNPTGMEAALIEDIDPSGEFVLTRTGVYPVEDITANLLLERIAANDLRIAKTAQTISEEEQETERAILVGIDDAESLDELERLPDTAGAIVVEKRLQRKTAPDPASYIGRGKAEELAIVKQLTEANLILIDDELTAAQSNKLEEIIGCRVVDRTALILDIFARRAATREGRLQVELAQYKYRYPRLSGSRGVALSRLGGGIGTRGPGESQLETDRRHIRRRINELEKEVQELEKQRNLRRRRRNESGIATVALVGYTNAGKSTLLNALSGSNVFAEDKLFATLDPVTRRIEYNNRPLLLTDTVGFIKKLPHDLVDAFRSTLEEAVYADVLLHVVDSSAPDVYDQYRTAREVLTSLGAGSAPTIVVLNKTDRLQEGRAEAFYTDGDTVVEISALNGAGLDTLLETIIAKLDESVVRLSLLIPYEKGALLSTLHSAGTVQDSEYLPGGVYINLSIDREKLQRIDEDLNKYAITEAELEEQRG